MITTILFYLAYIMVGFIVAYLLTKDSDTPSAFATWALIIIWPAIVTMLMITLIIFGPSQLIEKLRSKPD